MEAGGGLVRLLRTRGERDLDIVFMDRKGAMLRVYWDVKPGRLIFCPGASLAIERVSTKELPGQE